MCLILIQIDQQFILIDVAYRNKLDVIIRTKLLWLRWATYKHTIFYATYAGTLDNTISNIFPQKRETKLKKTEIKSFFCKFVDLLYFLNREQMKWHQLLLNELVPKLKKFIFTVLVDLVLLIYVLFVYRWSWWIFFFGWNNRRWSIFNW